WGITAARPSRRVRTRLRHAETRPNTQNRSRGTPPRVRHCEAHRPPRPARLVERQAELDADLFRRGEADREALDAADEGDAEAFEGDRVAGEFDIGQPRQQLTERDGQFAAGQVRAEAEVRTRSAEADVIVRRTQHVELLGL